MQVKHHLADHTLTDSTPELWRTLTVWMDLAESLPSGALPHLHLATTSSAHPESAAAVLGPEGRDVEAALGRLLKAGAEGTANTTQAARHRFVALERAKRLQILQAVTVLDTSVHVTDLHSRLRTALGLVVPSERLDEFLDRLQGW